MSIRIVLDELRRRGGHATTAELRQRYPWASSRLTVLRDQGYVTRDAHGIWHLQDRKITRRDSTAGKAASEGRPAKPCADCGRQRPSGCHARRDGRKVPVCTQCKAAQGSGSWPAFLARANRHARGA